MGGARASNVSLGSTRRTEFSVGTTFFAEEQAQRREQFPLVFEDNVRADVEVRFLLQVHGVHERRGGERQTDLTPEAKLLPDTL